MPIYWRLIVLINNKLLEMKIGFLKYLINTNKIIIYYFCFYLVIFVYIYFNMIIPRSIGEKFMYIRMYGYL